MSEKAGDVKLRQIKLKSEDMIPVVSTNIPHVNLEKVPTYIEEITETLGTKATGKVGWQPFIFHAPNIVPFYEGDHTLYMVLRLPNQGIAYYQRYIGKEKPEYAVVYLDEPPEKRDEERMKLASKLHIIISNAPERNHRAAFDEEIDKKELGKLKETVNQLVPTISLYSKLLHDSKKKIFNSKDNVSLDSIEI